VRRRDNDRFPLERGKGRGATGYPVTQKGLLHNPCCANTPQSVQASACSRITRDCGESLTPVAQVTQRNLLNRDSALFVLRTFLV